VLKAFTTWALELLLPVFLLKIAQSAHRQTLLECQSYCSQSNFSIQDLDLRQNLCWIYPSHCIALQQTQLLHRWFHLGCPVRQRLLHLCLSSQYVPKKHLMSLFCPQDTERRPILPLPIIPIFIVCKALLQYTTDRSVSLPDWRITGLYYVNRTQWLEESNQCQKWWNRRLNDTPKTTTRPNSKSCGRSLLPRRNSCHGDRYHHCQVGVKTTLYRYFPSKDDLVVAYLQDRDRRFWECIEAAMNQASDDPKIKLLAIFEWLEDLIAQPDCYGCPFLITITEFPALDYPGHQVAVAHKNPWSTHRIGEAHPGQNPKELGAHLLMLLMERL